MVVDMQKQNADNLYNEAELARKNGNLEQALSLYSQVLQAYPGSWLSYYGVGDIRMRQAQYMDAANAFALAWVHSLFRVEAGLMVGRALTAAKLTLSACLVFEKLTLERFDEKSLIIYADALRQEGRIREALQISQRFFEAAQSVDACRVRGDLYLEMNWLERAKAIIQPLLNLDNQNLFAHERLISIAMAENDWPRMREIALSAHQKVPEKSFCMAALLACEYLACGKKLDKDAEGIGNRMDLLDAAEELNGHRQNVEIKITGTNYQTFEYLMPMVLRNGLILEFGVRNGHTIHGIAEMFPDRNIFGFDSFQGLPEAWHEESAGSYSAAGRIPVVPKNVEFIVGWFNETLPDFKKTHPEPVAFMNVDCDLYSATKTILDELDEQIVPGTIIVFDEYIGNQSWRLDEFKAFQEWVASTGAKYEYLTASFYTKQVGIRILSR